MSSADRALAAIDEGLDLAAAPAYMESGYGPPGSDSPEWCWRCDAARASTDVGLCESCRAQMQDEKTTATDPVVERLRQLLLGAFATRPSLPLVLPPGPARDVEIEFDVAHAETCAGCLLRARNELSIEPEPGLPVLFDARGRMMGAPMVVRGLVTPENPEPSWVMLVFGSGRSHVIDGLIVDDPPPRVLDQEARSRWQDRAREFYTDEFRVGVWSSDA